MVHGCLSCRCCLLLAGNVVYQSDFNFQWLPMSNLREGAETHEANTESCCCWRSCSCVEAQTTSQCRRNAYMTPSWLSVDRQLPTPLNMTIAAVDNRQTSKISMKSSKSSPSSTKYILLCLRYLNNTTRLVQGRVTAVTKLKWISATIAVCCRTKTLDLRLPWLFDTPPWTMGRPPGIGLGKREKSVKEWHKFELVMIT